MFIVYDLIFLVITFIFLPVYLFRRKFHSGLLRRLGILPRDLGLASPIWIHAVNVGEVMAVKKLLEGLRQLYPDKRLVISTVTPTGNKVAKGLLKDGDFLTYLPLDFSFTVNRVINKIKPSLFIIAETEIWPNLIRGLYKKNIPVAIVNGRISDASFKGYSAIKFLLKPILRKVSLFCMQAESDAERLMHLGAAKEKIKIAGNMKFDAAPNLFRHTAVKLGIRPDEELIVAGSTHPGEEEVILEAYKDLLPEFPGLRLLIAPRHPERASDIEKLVEKNGFKPLLISKLLSTIDYRLSTIFILDTIGELLDYYAICDIVFVGGSLVKKGGHNILEPAALSKPIIFGPHTFNFRDIAQLYLKEQAAILAHNQQELKEGIKYLLANPNKKEELGRKAKDLILANQGATKRNLEYLGRVVNAK